MSETITHPSEEKELIFVYNARSDLFSKASDFAHKIISPGTYSCSLCSLTHGHFGVHRAWTDFIQRLPYQVKFLYKDQVKAYSKVELPQICLQQGTSKQVLIDAAELNAVSSLEALMVLIRMRLKEEAD